MNEALMAAVSGNVARACEIYAEMRTAIGK